MMRNALSYNSWGLVMFSSRLFPSRVWGVDILFEKLLSFQMTRIPARCGRFVIAKWVIFGVETAIMNMYHPRTWSFGGVCFALEAPWSFKFKLSVGDLILLFATLVHFTSDFISEFQLFLTINNPSTSDKSLLWETINAFSRGLIISYTFNKNRKPAEQSVTSGG